MKPDPDKIDEAALAMLFLTSFRKRTGDDWSAWKGLDWDALGRLHEKGLITSPVGKAKSVVFSEVGYAAARTAFERLCMSAGPESA